MDTNITIHVSIIVGWEEVMVGHPFLYPNPNISEYLYGDLCALDKDAVVLFIQAFHACLTVTLMTVCTPSHLQLLYFGFLWASIIPNPVLSSDSNRLGPETQKGIDAELS